MLKNIVIIIALLSTLTSCFESNNTSNIVQKELLIYVGTTLVKPIKQLSVEFEKKYNVSILINQGGSQDLYDALKTSKVGDLYIPGSSSYRVKNKTDGLLGRYKLLGHNQLAIVFAKHNPKNITNDLTQLLDPSLNVVLGVPSLSSVGRASKKLLSQLGIDEGVYKNAVYLANDSKHIRNSIKNGHADVALNWLATAFWDENTPYIDYQKIHQDLKKIEVNLLTFSKEKELANTFIDFISSEYGRATFKKYGF